MITIRRILQTEMEARLKFQKVLLLLGARRVGKTVLLRQMVNGFKGKTLLLNGESMDTLKLLENRSVTNYQQLFANVDLLAIDEAQHIPDVGLKLKLIVDEVPNIRVVATGSSSFDLRNTAGEPLVGRSTQFQLNPFSVEELLAVFPPFEMLQRREDYVIYGHYPELLSMESVKERQEYLNDVVDAYLLRDILSVDGIKHAQKMYDLLRLIAFQIGSEVSLDEIGSQLSLSRNTVERYLDLLQKVYVLFRIGGFSRNLRKEVRKTAKYYFYDTGIRNAILRDYKPLEDRFSAEQGALWENYVIAERIKRNCNHRLGVNFYFWRTYDMQEIDLIEEANGILSAYEIKAGIKKPIAPVAFSKAYPEVPFNVINRDNYLEFVK